MPGRSGQYSGVRGSGAVSPTAPGHETGGVGGKRGERWTATDRMPMCYCLGSVAPSWKEVGGGGPASPGFSRMLLAP